MVMLPQPDKKKPDKLQLVVVSGTDEQLVKGTPSQTEVYATQTTTN